MGLPNVFEFRGNFGFIGVGVSFEWHQSDYGKELYGKTLDICILLPFVCINIFCRKVKENKWI